VLLVRVGDLEDLVAILDLLRAHALCCTSLLMQAFRLCKAQRARHEHVFERGTANAFNVDGHSNEGLYSHHTRAVKGYLYVSRERIFEVPPPSLLALLKRAPISLYAR